MDFYSSLNIFAASSLIIDVKLSNASYSFNSQLTNASSSVYKNASAAIKNALQTVTVDDDEVNVISYWQGSKEELFCRYRSCSGSLKA